MSKRCIFLLALLLLPALAGAQAVQATQAASAEHKAFTVGVEEFYYAPHYFTVNGRYYGYGRDVLDLFARKRGYEFNYQPRPYVRMVKELLRGDIDFQYPDNPDWLTDLKRGHKIYYSQGVIDYADGISRRREDIGKPIGTLKLIAMPRGWTPIDYYPLVQRKELVIEEANSVEAVMQMLLSKRVDGVYLNADVVASYLAGTGLSVEAGFDKSLPYQFSRFSLASKTHPEVIKEFNQFLLDSASEIKKLKESYKFRYDVDPKALPY